MKVIAKKGHDTYICEVNHTEIEQFLGLYYGRKTPLKEGEEVNLGEGYDYASEIKEAFKQTQTFVKSNQKIITAIMNGLSVFGHMRK